MSGISGTLLIALSGLQAAQAGLNIVSRNVANANDPNYTRKVQSQEPLVSGFDPAQPQLVNSDGVQLPPYSRTVEEEDHPLPREWVVALLEKAAATGSKVDWINCGMCVDERGVNESVAGTRRGSPADLWKAAEASDNTLVIGAR